MASRAPRVLPPDVFEPAQNLEAQLIPPPPGRPLARLQSTVESHVRTYDLPSQAAAVLRGDSVEVAASGTLHRDSDLAVTRDSKYHLGSCTKMMTATMLARLVEKGKLNWSTTVSQVFPEADIHPDLKSVTLEMLLTHRAGVIPNINSLDFDYVKRAFEHQLPRQELALVALQRPGRHTPGEVFEYSNIGYTIAGAMAESVTGQSWEELMRGELFAPLAMDSAGFGPAGEDQPWGHDAQGKPVNPDWNSFWEEEQPAPPDNPPVIGPAGTVHCNLEDWAKFIRAQGSRDDSFLSKASWEYLQTPRRGENYTPGGWLTGANDHFKTEPGDLYHNGSNTMFYSFVRLRVADERGEPQAVMVVANENKGGPSHELAGKLSG